MPEATPPPHSVGAGGVRDASTAGCAARVSATSSHTVADHAPTGHGPIWRYREDLRRLSLLSANELPVWARGVRQGRGGGTAHGAALLRRNKGSWIASSTARPRLVPASLAPRRARARRRSTGSCTGKSHTPATPGGGPTATSLVMGASLGGVNSGGLAAAGIRWLGRGGSAGLVSAGLGGVSRARWPGERHSGGFHRRRRQGRGRRQARRHRRVGSAGGGCGKADRRDGRRRMIGVTTGAAATCGAGLGSGPSAPAAGSPRVPGTALRA